jgi:hypothetical protein
MTNTAVADFIVWERRGWFSLPIMLVMELAKEITQPISL